MNKKILCLLVSLLLAIPLFGATEKKSEVKVTKPSTSVSNKKDVIVKKDKEVITSTNITSTNRLKKQIKKHSVKRYPKNNKQNEK